MLDGVGLLMIVMIFMIVIMMMILWMVMIRNCDNNVFNYGDDYDDL